MAIMATSIFSTPMPGSTISLGSAPTTMTVNLPEEVNIGNKSIDDFINEKISQNLDKVVTRLPTDIDLGEREFLIIKAEVGDTPKEQVFNYLKDIREMFKEQGLTKVVIYPTYHGEGELQYSRLDVEDKLIE